MPAGAKDEACFDIREFHDAVLSIGPVPMAVLKGTSVTGSAEKRKSAGSRDSRLVQLKEHYLLG